MKLQGLRVVDLSLFLPGPLMTQFMADQGAEVIKVESLHGGEPNREIGAKRGGVSVYFANTHRGKKSLALNLKDRAGVEILMRLAERSDVLIEAYRPGVAETKMTCRKYLSNSANLSGLLSNALGRRNP